MDQTGQKYIQYHMTPCKKKKRLQKISQKTVAAGKTVATFLPDQQT